MKLSNSLNLHIKTIENVGYISFKICFNAGLAYEPEDKRGITHLLEHMLFRGIGKLDYTSLENCFNRMGAEVYGISGYDCLALSFSVLSAKVDEAIEYINELFQKPSWNSHDLKAEKKIVKHEIAIKGTDFSSRINRVYNNPILCKSVMGCISTVDRISLNDIKSYHSLVINPSNCTVFVSGDISDKDSEGIINALNNLSNNPQYRLTQAKSLLPINAFDRNSSVNIVYDNYEYSDLFIHFDVKKEYQTAARFIQYYLSGYTSPLSERLIDEGSYSYELGSCLDEWKGFSILIFDISVKYDSLCDVIGNFFDELKRIIDSFTYVDYERILSFTELEKKQIMCSPEAMNDEQFDKYFKCIPYETPSFNQVFEAFKGIFVKDNLSVYSTYSVKRKSVVESITKATSGL